MMHVWRGRPKSAGLRFAVLHDHGRYAEGRIPGREAPLGLRAAQTTRVTRSAAISSGSITESNETTLTWLLPNLSWAWFFLAPS